MKTPQAVGCFDCVWEPKRPYNERRKYCLYITMKPWSYHGEQYKLSTMDYLNGTGACPYFHMRPGGRFITGSGP